MRRFYLTLIGFIAGVTGFVLIAYNTNSYVAIGVTMLLFANNVENAIRHEKFRKAKEPVPQLSLLDNLEVEESWKKDWSGMPEFNQKDITSFNSIIVHFENRADMDAFSKLIGQKLTYKTRSIWYPEAEIGRMTDKLFVSEEAETASKNGETYYCESCKSVQPVELTLFDPDVDTEPNLIVCLTCQNQIGFINNL